MSKLRFKTDPQHPNIGFTTEEIDLLIQETQLDFPSAYLEFLKRAGKQSNSLNHHFKSVHDLVQFNQQFREIIAQSDVENFNPYSWCFACDEAQKNYYFFELNHPSNPTVFCFYNSSILIDNGWNVQQGEITKKYPFIDFINSKTEQRYGFSFWQKTKGYILLIIGSPFLVLFWLITRIPFYDKSSKRHV